ncbi:hypothetical protein AAVH_24691 [Aphelenchoides avenae]|nr:hypothetical protein AAVH_24691 [Aphelenchus avenae]
MGLKFTSKRCSALAHRCAGEIRIFDLSDVECVVYVNHVSAFPHRPNDKRSERTKVENMCRRKGICYESED